MVTVPGYKDPVEFPDSMSNEDIAGVLQKQRGSFSEPKDVSGEARKNLKKIPLQEQQMAAQEESLSAADHEKHLKNALWMTRTSATVAPFVLAAPFTAGTSLAAGGAIMGGAGLASGATREAMDATAGEKKSWGEVTKNLAWDTVIGAGTEMGLRPIAALGGKFLEGQLLRSAQKSQAGKKMVEGLETDAHQAIEGLVKGREADVRGIYQSFVGKLTKIPKGRGPTGEILAGEPKGAVGDLAEAVRKELATDSAGGLSSVTKKGMDELIQMHSHLNELVHSPAAKEVTQAARKAAGELADDMRGLITKNLSPEERSLFEGAKEITKQKLGLYAGQNLASQVVKRMAGGAVGLAAGLATHSYQIGLAAGGAAEAIETKFAPIVLEHLATAGKLPFQKAVNAILKSPETSETILNNAIPGLLKSIPVEFRNTVKEYAKKYSDQAAQTMGSVVNQGTEAKPQ
jgi:hypothetical protein